MRIAQLAPLFESVPPVRYGGSERVVSYLTEELVKMGHEVSLFASGDSVTSAKLVACAPQALRLAARQLEPTAMHLLLGEAVLRGAPEFDVIHNHIEQLFYPLARRCGRPVVTTLHGRMDLDWLEPVYREYSEQAVVSISAAQRAPLPWLHWVATVHHGLPLDLHRFEPGPGRYLAFVGRISPEKRVDRAIEIAARCGMPLRIAAKIDAADAEYFEAEVKPLLDHPLVEYVGEVGEREKGVLMGGAAAVLFPIDWPEPFGLIMVEALACGTPVIAWAHGSVPEVLEDGVTGFLCSDIDAAVRAVQRLGTIDRAACRKAFETRFTAERMARDYLALYGAMIEAREARTPVAQGTR